MGNNKDIRIVLGVLRYKSAPETTLALQVPFVQTYKQKTEFERSIDIKLTQVYDDERQKSTLFRPAAKFSIIFKNSYTGKTTGYVPFENNLYYTNASQIAKLACDKGEANVDWEGFPQYSEFDFIRNDYNVPGYTIPPNNHVDFAVKSASSYNWAFYTSYPYDNNYSRQLRYNFTNTDFITWSVGDGIPFIITNITENGNNLVSFKCPMKHGLSVGEYVKLSFKYLNDDLFEVYSLGDGTTNSEWYVFNIYNYGFMGNTFDDNTKGTFKRVLDIDNPDDTTSEYYIKRLKILTNEDDSVITKSGFEQNIFGKKKKYESPGFTPNKVGRVSIKEGSQSYNMTLNKDINIEGLIDNQKRPITEIYFNVIWKGYFGWTLGPASFLKFGYDFNLPLVSGLPSPWWGQSNSNAVGISKGNYTKSNKLFYYVNPLKVGNVIDGDLCEWNDYEQIERTVSDMYHKFTLNNTHFVSTFVPKPTNSNMFGYYYKPHNKITLRVYSDYTEDAEGDGKSIVPNYSYFSTNKNLFIWRDIYTYGYKDPNGRGVDYPFINGRHYPFNNFVFKLIPEGTNFVGDDIITDPIFDACE
jgi:hypothetical protein